MANRTVARTRVVQTLKGDMEVRPIPPKLLREIRKRATKAGTLDFNELMVWQLVYGLKDPSFSEAEVRALLQKYTLGAFQPIVDRIDEISGTDEHLRGVDESVPPRLRRFAEQMVMASAWLNRFPEARTTRSPRARGAGRPAAKRVTVGSRDGPSDEGESSEPPQAGRLCICPCARDISHKRAGALYFDPEACRKRYQRERDRAHPDRVVARKLKRLALAEDLEHLVAEELPAGCRCPAEGVDIDPEGVPVCIACGRPVTVRVRAVNGYDAHLAEVRGWMRNERVESRQVHRRHRPRDWRTGPSRELSAKLRRTRKTWRAAV